MSYFLMLQSWEDIDKTAASLRSSIENLCYVLCALFGLIGSIRIYNKWQLDHHRHLNLDAEIAGWFGASLFFFIATTLIDSVF